MPFLGHSPYDGLDVSPDGTPSIHSGASDPVVRARSTVRRFAVDPDDEAMLLELLGLREPDTVAG